MAEFYSGKTLHIVVGFSAGGGFDTYARLIGRHLGTHIPGNPTIVVENMPGAGSLLAANDLYNVAPKDGTVVGHFIGGLVVQKEIGENPAVQFDADKFNWLGLPITDTPACAVGKDSGFTTLEQARTKEMILGGEGPGAGTVDIPNVLKAVGLNIKLVSGYGGTSDIRVAADRGEVQGGCWTWQSMKVTWRDGLESGDVVVVGQGGAAPHPDLPKVPMMQDLARTPEERQLIEAGITIPNQITRPFALPPGVPEERVQAVRQAFQATLRDPNFLADAEKAKLEVQPGTAEDIQSGIDRIKRLSPEIKKQLKTILYPQ